VTAEARANALADLRALQTSQAEPAEYVAPLTAAVEAVGIRGLQRRRQRRHILTALQMIEVVSPDAQRSIDAAIDWLARYP
jgi:hypothetical protein